MSAPGDGPWVIFDDTDNMHLHADIGFDVVGLLVFAQLRPDLSPTQRRTKAAAVLTSWWEGYQQSRRN